MMQSLHISALFCSILPLLSLGSAQATFLYPTGGDLVINYIDTLDVTYTTEWEATNLTLFCLVATNDYSFYGAPTNPIHANGTYILPNIEQGLGTINQYPVGCHIQLIDSTNASQVANGANFIMTSTAGVTSTYQISTATQVATSTNPTTTSTSTSTLSTQGGTAAGSRTGSTATIASTNTASATGTSAGLSGASSTPSPTPLSASTGLSTGAKAGIGIGVALGVLAILAGLLYLFLTRRRKNSQAKQNNGPAGVGYPAGQPEKTHGYSDAAPGPVYEAPGRNDYQRPQELGTQHPQQGAIDGRYELGP